MLKKLIENTKIQVLIVAAAAFITFLPTLENFFYLDEWGNLYEWTHGYNYQYFLYTAHVFRLLFNAYGTNPTGYYAWGLAVYVLSAVIFYFLVARLLKNKVLGLIAGLFYATSPIGMNTSTMVWTYIAEGGYPLTVMLLTLLYLLLSYIQTKRKSYIFLTVFFFLLFLDLMPRRAFMFFPTMVLFDYLYSVRSFKRFIPDFSFISRFIVLFVGFVAYYKYDLSLTKIFFTHTIQLSEAASSYDWAAKVLVAKTAIVAPGPFITLTNILLAGPWLFISQKLTGYVNLADINQIGFLVATTLALAIGLIVLGFKVKTEWGRMLLFSLGWIHINILGIYIFSSPGVSDSTHRTLSLAAPGYALFVTLAGATLYTFFAKKKKKNILVNRIFIVLFVALLAANFLATRSVLEAFNQFHSRPAHAFFKSIKTFYPTLSPNPIIYMDTTNEPQTKYQLSRIYGGSNYGAGATLAVFYPEITKEEIKFTRDWAELQKFIGGDATKIDHVYAFYYDKSGLRDTTQETRSELKGTKKQ